MWANYIKTNDVNISAADAVNMKYSNQILALTLDQQEFVIRLRKLANKALMANK